MIWVVLGLACGLLVVAVMGVFWAAGMASTIDDLSERLDAKPDVPAPRAPLEQQDRQSMQAAWPMVCCQHCGLAHPGECPRVRRVVAESDQAGRVLRTDIWYWDNASWEPPSDALTADQVWGTSVPLPPPVEEEPKK